ncbi:helix-turn-helix domain-containing protein [Streptomyces sp. NPDC101219]|uniref:helix-turn-helix domain-containing protein n=1 Tax=Streptomyces sp. NPDC101219 TaxID=3366131 RepID=UPI0037F6E2EF
MAGQVPPPDQDGKPVGDLGRRLAHRRTELGLTREETASRAGLAPSYLAHLEEHAGASPGTGVLIRLAGVLGTTLNGLTGGDTDMPPGTGRAAPHAEFSELDEEESRALLGTHGVGRLALATDDGPFIVPVNYDVVDGAVVFRTAPGTTPARAAGHRVAFEVDRIDDALSQGWSVQVRGDAVTVTDPEETARLTERAYSRPWAGAERDRWMRIEPFEITGRRISA